MADEKVEKRSYRHKTRRVHARYRYCLYCRALHPPKVTPSAKRQWQNHSPHWQKVYGIIGFAIFFWQKFFFLPNDILLDPPPSPPVVKSSFGEVFEFAFGRVFTRTASFKTHPQPRLFWAQTLRPKRKCDRKRLARQLSEDVSLRCCHSSPRLSSNRPQGCATHANHRAR